jgi:tetratricopeptide (TPR) repeat protein
MKKLTILFIAFVAFQCIHSQTRVQQGCVKTRGRMVNGAHVPGKGLPGAVVAIKGGNTVGVKNDNGSFSFTTKGNTYVVESVTKKDYVLVDADAAPKTYTYSANVVNFVMETPEQNFEDQRNAQKKFRTALEQKCRTLESEIENLKSAQKISQQEYYKLLQELDAQREQNEKLIKDMATRYAALDYDAMDDFYRKVCFYMEECDFVKADSLLRSRGDVVSQVETNLIQQDLVKLEREELARRCYSFFESFSMQHANDSAAKYIELRARLDTTNVEWQYDVAKFLDTYLANYPAALVYYNRSLRHALQQYGENSEQVALYISHIAIIRGIQGDYSTALDLFKKALSIQEQRLGKTHPDVGPCYTNVGAILRLQGKHKQALEYLEKGVEIQVKVKAKTKQRLLQHTIILQVFIRNEVNLKRHLNILKRLFASENFYLVKNITLWPLLTIIWGWLIV